MTLQGNIDQTITSVKIYDVTGHLLMVRSVQKSEFSMQTNGLLPGLYFVKINTLENYTIEKVILE